jgi:hypothetical protein
VVNSLLTTSVAVLNSCLKSVGGVGVTYRRGNDSIDSLIAVPVRVRHDELPIEPANITAREQDFIVAADDLTIGGAHILPKRGDSMDWVDSRGVKRTFRVVPRLGDREYRFSDQTRLMIRVYTTEVVPSSE